ncbi:alpha/beta hydrolase [Prochlorococcus sp. MIT 1307]|uniref:alpha/beta fold hydrolase n=1 Tax=Prochlorococcus sp. MIT 1307 TaxID=3096219 RepID=UPI002A764D00|nr:alpha/beta hydrolase [Prochlorococcus sp. MIT 1307]
MIPNQKPKFNLGSDSKPEKLLNTLKDQLLDPLAKELANTVQWKFLRGVSQHNSDLYPIAITGKGSPILLLHGFDSSFLEFRRIVPLLKNHHQLLIPDLYGFGFCPRPHNVKYGPNSLISHIEAFLNLLAKDSPIGLIGASMGGALAIEIARRNHKKVNRLLLLSPAGLTGRPMPVPRPLDQLGVWFLSQKFVRKSLCRQAFAHPNLSVGLPEEQIASLHLSVPGWGRSLAAFARSGGIANYGSPLPNQPINVLWGAKDNILNETQKKECIALLGKHLEELKECGHLPHLDLPKVVADRWLSSSNNEQ